MPRKVTLPKNREFVFKSAKGGKAARYAWDEWLSGDLLLIEQSVGKKNEAGDVIEVGPGKGDRKDYEARTVSMPGKIRFAARMRYKMVDISKLDADGKPLGDALIIRARPMTPDEREEEDVKRAEEKAEKARKAQKNGATEHVDDEDEAGSDEAE